MIEGLLVLLHAGLTVVGSHQVAAAVADRAGIVQAALLRKADGGIIRPRLIASGIVVRPLGGVHHVVGPDGCILAAIEEDHVIERLIAACRMSVGVNRYLAIVAGSIHAVPVVVTVGVGAALAKARAEARHARHTEIAQIHAPGRLGSDRSSAERNERAVAIVVLLSALVILGDKCLVVIGLLSIQTGNAAADAVAGYGSDAGVVVRPAEGGLIGIRIAEQRRIGAIDHAGLVDAAGCSAETAACQRRAGSDGRCGGGGHRGRGDFIGGK